MDYLANELYAGELAPVLLGDSRFARFISRSVFMRHNLISHVFCKHISFLRRFCLTAKYHAVHGFEKDDLLLIALQDFAATVQNRDIILYLIPGTEFAKAFIERNRERLEPDFVIANKTTLSKLIGKETFL